jgi:hypothetical protein
LRVSAYGGWSLVGVYYFFSHAVILTLVYGLNNMRPQDNRLQR